MGELRTSLDGRRLSPELIAYERYLRYFARRLSPSLVKELSLLDPTLLKTGIARDPSRFDLLIDLAHVHLAEGRTEEARMVLLRVSASGFSEARVARQLLTTLIDKALGW
jgi:thioredoxin-like negative regulator of GroEL